MGDIPAVHSDPPLDGALIFQKGVLPSWIFEVDTVRFVDVNEAAVRHYGWSRDEFLQLTLFDVRPPEERDRLRRYLDNRGRPGSSDRDFGPWVHWKKGGALMEVQVHTVDVPFNGRPCRVATMFDVTHANATARRLRESEAQLRTIVEEMPVIFNALDDRGNAVFWNREAEQVTGYGKDEVIGNPNFLETVYPDPAYRARMMDELQRRMGEYRDWEWNVRCKDGSERTIAWSSISARVPIAGWAAWGIGIDVTREREAEARMRTLSRRVLEVQEEERRAVSLELHDDIGQALTAIKLNLEAVRRGSAVATLDSSILLVEDAIREVRALAYALRPQILDDLGLAQALRWLVERTIERTGLKLRADVSIPDVAIDAATSAACFRIAQEALTNVVRHSNAENARVSLQVDEALVLSVEDDGVGFDPVAVQARARRGGGLGVTGMEERARLAGGRLHIQAAAGSGTRICAVFPREAGDK